MDLMDHLVALPLAEAGFSWNSQPLGVWFLTRPLGALPSALLHLPSVLNLPLGEALEEAQERQLQASKALTLQ